LLLFVSVQILMIGMVADGVVRRIAQVNRPHAPTHRAIAAKTALPLSNIESNNREPAIVKEE